MRFDVYRRGIYYRASVSFVGSDARWFWYAISARNSIYFITGHAFFELLITRAYEEYQGWSIRSYIFNASILSAYWDRYRDVWQAFLNDITNDELTNIDFIYRRNRFGETFVEVNWGPRSKLQRSQEAAFELRLLKLANRLTHEE